MCGALLAAVSWNSAAWAATNPVVTGEARFTVVTPECIRIEYAPGGKFLDDRSLFAVERKARYDGFKLSKSGASETIDTGAIRLTYTPDGKPLGPSNLSAKIKTDKGYAAWTPGAANPGNLGGTVTTLDGAKGPVDIGKGLLSRDGWYVIDDSRTPLLTSDWVRSRPQDAGSDWYLFGYGSDYKGALKSLVTIGGAAPMPRRYAMGLWYSRYWPFSSDEYHSVVQEYAQHDFPLDNIVMDMDWHRDGWTGWSWNNKLISDPKALLAWFHQQGLHVTLNMHPADGVAPHEDQYAPFMKALGEDPAAGKNLPFDAGSKPYMDAFFSQVLAPLENDGVDFWWLDWQQYRYTRSIPDLTNLFWMNQLLYDRTELSGARGISLSRWAGWGDHRHPIQFSGDADAGWAMLGFEVPFTSTAGNVGCYYWSHDIGGHNGGRNEESYTRWCQFGATTATIRSHSSRDASTDRRPWNYPKWAEDSMRVSFHLRSQLLPYIYSSAHETYATGVSLNRPLYLEYPGEYQAYRNGQEYLLGANILTAPIAMPGVGPGRVGRQAVWFPKGSAWYNTFTGEKYAGNTEQMVSADINEFPLYARGGVPLPMQPYAARPATTALDNLRVRCYPGENGKTGSYTFYEDDGESQKYTAGAYSVTPLTYVRHGGQVTVTIGAAKGQYAGQVAQRGYTVELPNTDKAMEARVDGQPAVVSYDPALCVTRISVPARSLRKPVKIEVQAAEADAGVLSARAQNRRLAGIAGDAAQGKNWKQVLADSSDLTDAQKEALLALGGVALVRQYEDTAFSGERGWHFYGGDGVIQGNAANLSDPRLTPKLGDGLAKATLEVKIPHDHGVDIADMEKSVIASGAFVETPGVKRSNPRVTFQIDGHDYALPLSAPIGGADNVALQAHAVASSSENGHTPAAAIDGIAEGYPINPAAEWSTGEETTGATLTLTWDTPQAINQIALYDRPNTVDQVTSGVITFSDGSTLDVGALPDDGSTPLSLSFPAKTITSLTFKVTGVKESTEHTGLAEIVVRRAK
jgi:alpha-glucosidase (family GH31 glycosyl hydrolase)